MRKILKRIAALSAAVMMMGTMVISASAATVVQKIGGYSTTCGAYTSGNGLYISTSVNSNSVSVSVSGSATYKYNGVSKSTGNGNGGLGGTTAIITKKSGGVWTALTTTHSVNGSSKTISDATWKNNKVI